MMRVSRTTIREALRGLEAEKLITIVPNRGPSARSSWEEAEQIYEARGMLEGDAAVLFANKATAQETRRMRFGRCACGGRRARSGSVRCRTLCV